MTIGSPAGDRNGGWVVAQPKAHALNYPLIKKFGPDAVS